MRHFKLQPRSTQARKLKRNNNMVVCLPKIVLINKSKVSIQFQLIIHYYLILKYSVITLRQYQKSSEKWVEHHFASDSVGIRNRQAVKVI